MKTRPLRAVRLINRSSFLLHTLFRRWRRDARGLLGRACASAREFEFEALFAAPPRSARAARRPTARSNLRAPGLCLKLRPSSPATSSRPSERPRPRRLLPARRPANIPLGETLCKRARRPGPPPPGRPQGLRASQFRCGARPAGCRKRSVARRPWFVALPPSRSGASVESMRPKLRTTDHRPLTAFLTGASSLPA